MYCKDVDIGRQSFLFSGVYCGSSVLDVKGLHQGSMRVNNINYYCFKHDCFDLNRSGMPVDGFQWRPGTLLSPKMLPES